MIIMIKFHFSSLLRQEQQIWDNRVIFIIILWAAFVPVDLALLHRAGMHNIYLT